MKNYILVLFFVLAEVVHAGAVTFVKPATVAIEEPIAMPKDTNPKDVDPTISAPEFKDGISPFITATFIKAPTGGGQPPLSSKDTNPKDVDPTISDPKFKDGISQFITASFIKAPTDAGQPPLSSEEKVKLINSLKLELKNADESSQPALLERLKKVSQAISSKPENDKGASEHFYKDRGLVNAQRNSNQNMMQMNNQITIQQAEIRQNTVSPVPKSAVGY